MAVNLDTRSKRASSVQILAPYNLAPVYPNGTITANDRQHIAWTYASIPGYTTPDCRTIIVAAEDRTIIVRCNL